MFLCLKAAEQAHQSLAPQLCFGTAACLCLPVVHRAVWREYDLCLQQTGQRKQPILLVYFKQMYNCCNDMLSMCFSRSDLILQEMSRISSASHVHERLSRCLLCPYPPLVPGPGTSRHSLLAASQQCPGRMKQCLTYSNSNMAQGGEFLQSPWF